ncbi:MAG TPA: hypothetical protein VN222_14405, partial [Novosphingobium sp.]|nr:hypothetical protein [Novosphingobium sp.]
MNMRGVARRGFGRSLAGLARQLCEAGAVAALMASGAALAQADNAAAPALASPAAQHWPPALEDFSALPFASMLRLSPDGQRMAGLMSVGGQRRVCVLPLFDGTKSLKCAAIIDMAEVRGLTWVGNDNIVIRVVQLLPVEGSNWYISRLLGFNGSSGKVTKIKWDLNGQNASDILWVAPASAAPEIVMAGQGTVYTNDTAFWPSAYRVNVETGAASLEQAGREKVMDWQADGTGRVRLGSGYDDLASR